MRFRSSLWFGFVLGFLFGTLGMWILALLSLAFQPIELLAGPLFGVGRWVAQFLEEDGSMGNGGVTVLMLVNGAFYGIIGMAIQKIVQRVR